MTENLYHQSQHQRSEPEADQSRTTNSDLLDVCSCCGHATQKFATMHSRKRCFIHPR